MSTSPSPLTQTTPRKTSVKAPLILLGITFGILMFGVQWMRSLAESTSPIYHQTKSGWQQFPTPAGFPEKIRVSNGGTIWLHTWGRTVLSRWDGSRWRSIRDTTQDTKTTYRDGTFALDGEQVWYPADQGILHWDGQRWSTYKSVTPSQAASIVAGGGQIWIVDSTRQFFHFENGKWTSKKLALPGMNASVGERLRGAGPYRRRHSVAGVRMLWRLNGDIWLPVISDGKLWTM